MLEVIMLQTRYMKKCWRQVVTRFAAVQWRLRGAEGGKARCWNQDVVIWNGDKQTLPFSITYIPFAFNVATLWFGEFA